MLLGTTPAHKGLAPFGTNTVHNLFGIPKINLHFSNLFRTSSCVHCHPCRAHTYPNLKIVLKELKKQTKTFNSKDKLDLIKRLVDQDIFELQQIAFEYLQSQKNLYKSLTEEYIESFVQIFMNE
jgi:NADH:ubiquinone oxidoreductase subunit F (NADH-binding)